MGDLEPELLDKIRQQFEFAPYPRTPLEKSPKDNANLLFIHNLVTPFYLRNQRVLDLEGKVILDAGCGSGYKSLVLAEANPGAQIVGIDLSEESVKLARQRLEYHNIKNAEFHVLSIENLPQLGFEFDYINNDELLYLFPDPAVALHSMKSVLKPAGILRSNLHCYHQRANLFRAQTLCRVMGLMDNNPEALEIEILQTTMKALKDQVRLKAETWTSKYEAEDSTEVLLMNYLFQGDKGYTIPDLFDSLRQADLEFVSMVNWRQWELMDLFKDPENLPTFFEMSLPEISVEERLHIFELLHPIHRLLDFWCAHPEQGTAFKPVADWELSDWQRATAHLHPQLRTTKLKEALLKCVREQKPFEISQDLSVPVTKPIPIDSTIASCLLPLWDGPQTVLALAQRWLRVRPLNPLTLEPVSPSEALEEIRQLLTNLEVFLYVLLEIPT